MAHLWIEDAPGDWAIVSLSPTEQTPVDRVARLARAQSTAALPATDSALIGREGAVGRESWLLFASPASRVRVNGHPLSARLRVLADRDEIRSATGASVFFSTETLARVVPMPQTERPMECPRCRQPIPVNSPALCCPNARCALWYHQSDEFSCWLYAERCIACEQATALDAGYRWTPGEL